MRSVQFELAFLVKMYLISFIKIFYHGITVFSIYNMIVKNDMSAWNYYQFSKFSMFENAPKNE